MTGDETQKDKPLKLEREDGQKTNFIALMALGGQLSPQLNLMLMGNKQKFNYIFQDVPGVTLEAQ